MKKTIRSLTVVFAIFAFAMHSAAIFFDLSLPDTYNVSPDEKLSIGAYGMISSGQNGEKILQADKNQNQTSKETVTLKIFNLIPIKEVSVNSQERRTVTVSGQPFGIKLYSRGVMVVGMSDIEATGGTSNPAADAGLEIGDMILEVGGNKVSSNEEVAKYVEESDGNALSILIERGGHEIVLTLHPVLSASAGRYMAGIWVRDSSAGIGTLTFCDDDGIFGGLGHPICDSDTGKIIPISKGEIVPAEIGDVTKSVSGCAGELKGYFCEGKLNGTISLNGETGIYGKLDPSSVEGKKMTVAHCQEIEIGPAQVLSTIGGSTPKLYECIIERINYNGTSEAKNMTVRITDEALIAKTGGIVQGMSGSPIIQNGRLIGAVTHVFVNNPTCGYAVFAEKMCESSEKVEKALSDIAA